MPLYDVHTYIRNEYSYMRSYDFFFLYIHQYIYMDVKCIYTVMFTCRLYVYYCSFCFGEDHFILWQGYHSRRSS